MRDLVLVAVEWRPTYRFVALALHEDGREEDVSALPETAWSCSNPALIRFDSQSPGKVHGSGTGRVTITAEYAGVRASYALACRNGGLTTDEWVHVQGHNFLLRGIAREFYFDRAQPSSFSLSPPGAAELLTGNGGMCFIRTLGLTPITVTARHGGDVYERKLAVRELPITFSGDLFNERRLEYPDYVVMFTGDETETCLIIKAGNFMVNQTHNLIWTSSEPEVLALDFDDDGLRKIIACKPGNSVLRVSCLGASLERVVHVQEPPEIQWF